MAQSAWSLGLVGTRRAIQRPRQRRETRRLRIGVNDLFGPNRGRDLLGGVARALGGKPSDVEAEIAANVDLVSSLLEAARRGDEHAFPTAVVLPVSACADAFRWFDALGWRPIPAETKAIYPCPTTRPSRRPRRQPGSSSRTWRWQESPSTSDGAGGALAPAGTQEMDVGMIRIVALCGSLRSDSLNRAPCWLRALGRRLTVRSRSGKGSPGCRLSRPTLTGR